MALSSTFCIYLIITMFAFTAQLAEANVIPNHLRWIFDNDKSLNADSKFYIKTRHDHRTLQSE